VLGSGCSEALAGNVIMEFDPALAWMTYVRAGLGREFAHDEAKDAELWQYPFCEHTARILATHIPRVAESGTDVGSC